MENANQGFLHSLVNKLISDASLQDYSKNDSSLDPKKLWFSSSDNFIEAYKGLCESLKMKSFEDCTDQEKYNVLATMVALAVRSISKEGSTKHKKKVYYFSLEFLIGPLLNNYLINLGIEDIVSVGLEKMGCSLINLSSLEKDPGLGNGGLGRLAACFLDSMASMGIAGYGCGMRYKYGLFKQEIVNGCQVEKADTWLEHGYPWEVRVPESAVIVTFGGKVVKKKGKDGRVRFKNAGGEQVLAVPYDIPIVGYGGKQLNKLRIWSAEPYIEQFDLEAFNNGNYAAAVEHRTNIEAISTLLYPNDLGEHGKLLRLKQEYLFVSAGLQTILRSYKKEHGTHWDTLPEFVAIHTNDTHPSLCGPELMRLLIDEYDVDFDKALDLARKTVSYTNHTIMPEAMEKWPIDMLRELIPRTLMIIEEVDRRFREEFPRNSKTWFESLSHCAILWDNNVNMANCSVIFSHSVNGVSDLHTSILQENILRDFFILYPEKFNNKTNGVSHRRFLLEANPGYSKLISKAIGCEWISNASNLKKLEKFENDDAFLDDFLQARQICKQNLSTYIEDHTGVVLDPHSIFDVQVKRFHAYKRQLLSVFKILDLYKRMLEDSNFKPPATSFIFAGKAAQSYSFAKEVIRLINSVAHVINNDSRVNEFLKVAFVPNFAVSNAQLIYPAADISEQISWAGSEASGTSNMKLMMNGAITLGTYDGSNIEISELVGKDNIKIFGLSSQEVSTLRVEGKYDAFDAYCSYSGRLGDIIKMLTDDTLAQLSGNFDSIRNSLMISNDYDLVLEDFTSYVEAWEQLCAEFKNRKTWAQKSVHNTACSGFFSSDRTIYEYARDIWECI